MFNYLHLNIESNQIFKKYIDFTHLKKIVYLENRDIIK